MQSAVWVISFSTALLSNSAAVMIPAAMNASRSAYSTDEMAFSSVHRSIRKFRILFMAFPFPVVLLVELSLGNSGDWRNLIYASTQIQKVDQAKRKITLQLSRPPITNKAVRVRREYLPTVRTVSLSIGRPNSLGAGALSVRNISNTPRLKRSLLQIMLFWDHYS